VKTFILDTNVLINDPLAIYNFGSENRVVIPLMVIQELDGIKTRKTSTGTSARMAIRELDKLRETGQLFRGVELPSGGTLKVDTTLTPPKFDIFGQPNADHYILQCAFTYQDLKECKTVLVTEDQHLRILADSLGMTVERYKNALVKNDDYYISTPRVFLKPEQVSNMMKGARIEIEPPPEVARYVQVDDSTTFAPATIGKYDPESSTLSRVPLDAGTGVNVYGLRSRNREQLFALDALMDPDITLVVLAGQAGTGKTIMAMAAGLQQCHESDLYKKMTVARPVVPMGNELGFLPGSLSEKLDPWMGSIKDSLDHLVKPIEKRGQQPFSHMDHLVDLGVMDVQALQYIRGRSLPNQFVLIDEAQQLTPHEVKTIITRAGEGTKVVLTGDPYQIDSPYLDQYNNGIAFVIDRFKGQKCFASVTLHRGERSELAELASKLLG
jgi:PhoH-like ATPase